MSSIKQIEANRLNAGKSTGPRTTEGKSVVAANALKHGIFARSPALAGENTSAFSDLKDALLLRFQPATPEEEVLVSTASLVTPSTSNASPRSKSRSGVTI